MQGTPSSYPPLCCPERLRLATWHSPCLQDSSRFAPAVQTSLVHYVAVPPIVYQVPFCECWCIPLLKSHAIFKHTKHSEGLSQPTHHHAAARVNMHPPTPIMQSLAPSLTHSLTHPHPQAHAYGLSLQNNFWLKLSSVQLGNTMASVEILTAVGSACAICNHEPLHDFQLFIDCLIDWLSFVY